MEDETETGKPEAKRGYSSEYVGELREENKATRLKMSDLKRQLEEQATKYSQLEEQVAAHATEKAALEEKISEAGKSAKAEVAVARVEALAVKEGLVDPDTLALMDKSQFVFDDSGKLTNGAEVLQAFKTAKPHLFGSPNSSQTEPAPKPGDSGPLQARDLSDKEWAAYKKSNGID